MDYSEIYRVVNSKDVTLGVQNTETDGASGLRHPKSGPEGCRLEIT